MSDSEAIALAVSGDPSGFQTLHTNHRQAVYRQCLRALRDPDDAEDVTQEVFLQLHQKLNRFEGRCDFRTWLYRVTQNKIIAHIRHGSARPPTGAGDFPERGAAPTQHTLLEVQQALETLTPIERFCVEAKMDGHSMKTLGGSHYLRSAYKHLREVLV